MSLVLLSSNASANILIVTTLSDTDDPVCDSSCSLREAIRAAEPGDTIIFDRELRSGTIQLSKELVIDKRLTIDGPNKRRITLKGDGTFRLIDVKISGSAGRVFTIDGLILSGGAEPTGDGGAIYMDPTLQSTIVVSNCAIVKNSARHGGGIYTYFGTLYLLDSTVSENAAKADDAGAGIESFQSTVRILNSTISGNTSLSIIGGAGGVYLAGSRDWYVVGSTIANNSAMGSGSQSTGGLIALNGIPGLLANTIIAKNTGTNPDIYGRISRADNSFLGIIDPSVGITNGVNGTIAGSAKSPADPLLLSLADNGGGLGTYALEPSSQAIDSGSNPLSRDRQGQPESVDERGYQRISNNTVDMGSYESTSRPADFSSTVVGRATTTSGRGIAGARVILRDLLGVSRTVITNPFGYFRLDNLMAEQTYVISCSDKRNSFPDQTVPVEESVEYVNFVSK